MKISACLAAAALICAAPAAAVTYSTNLSGLNEVPANASPATGFGSIEVANDGNSIHVLLNWSGLTAPAAASHVHCCSAAGVNAPVAVGFSPLAATAGAIDAFYDLTLSATYSAGFRNANGGTAASARAAFLAGLAGGNAYLNIHDANFPGGEIRGQLALSVVPEPACWALMIGGFGLVGGALRQRRVATA